MTATERLRELLDERGVEWWNDTDPEPQRQTNVWAGGQLVMFHENANGTVGYVVYNTHDLTPEQAIAATLGDGGVGRSKNGVAERGTRYERLFGTPERAARAIVANCQYHGSFECSFGCLADGTVCGCGDYDELLEWLRGDAE